LKIRRSWCSWVFEPDLSRVSQRRWSLVRGGLLVCGNSVAGGVFCSSVVFCVFVVGVSDRFFYFILFYLFIFLLFVCSVDGVVFGLGSRVEAV